MQLLAAESHVTIETEARGLLAAAAHDLRIEAPIGSGETEGELRATARFPVASMRVAASRRHGTSEWHDPSRSDASDIEGRIRTEVFEGVREVVVEASVASPDATRATITVRAKRSQTSDVPVRIERDGESIKVHGRCELSLSALGTGKVHVPLGAIKVDDRVLVIFDVVLSSRA